MACDPQYFSGVTPEQLNEFIAKGTAAGIAISRSPHDLYSGIAEHGHVQFTWSYYPAEQTLRIQCVSHPLLEPCGAINRRVVELVEVVKKSTGLSPPPA